VRNISSKDINDILAVSRTRNALMGITGMLLFADDSFIQVLEGDKEAVEAVFASIVRDARHQGVTALVRENIASRDFSNWSMGFERVAGGFPTGLTDAFLIESGGMRKRLAQAALEVRSFIYGFLEIAAR
jgi:hypothetical protein